MKKVKYFSPYILYSISFYFLYIKVGKKLHLIHLNERFSTHKGLSISSPFSLERPCGEIGEKFFHPNSL